MRRSSRPARALAILAATPLLAGCPSLTTVGPARTLGRGEVRAFVQLGGYAVTIDNGPPGGPADREKIWFPQLDAGVSFGLTDAVDLTGRAWIGGGSLSARFGVVRASSVESGLDVALEPSLGYTAIELDDRVSGMFGALALPVGLNLGGGSQLVAAPRILWVNDRVAGSASLAGGSLGIAIRLPSSVGAERYLVPECGIVTPIGGPAGEFGGPLTQCGIGFATNRR